ncbi:MAG: lysophospholipid acyltransferase family protein [Planctomycetota bacterium]
MSTSPSAAGPAGGRRRPDTPLRRRVRHARRRIGRILIPSLAPAFLRALSRTWRLEELHRDRLERVRSGPGWLATMWHGRMLVPLPAYRDQRLRVLVSPSEDGELAARLLRRFGYEIIRGSTNEAPARALRHMLRELQGGGSIVITPDGPRGPRHSMNPGPAWISRATGFPVLPCGCVCDRAWHMPSWDRFTIPKPRARIALVYGEPILVDCRASDAEIDAATERIAARMLEAEELGFHHLGCGRDW